MTSLLRPRLAAAVAAPCRLRWFSAAPPRCSGQFTLAVPPLTSKQSVLAALQSRRDALGSGPASPDDKDNAAVVLASPEFATWLEDEAFISGLLHKLPLAADDTPEDVRVLAAVVAALAPPATTNTAQTLQTPLSGFSVVYGNADRLLPHMQPPDRAGSKTAFRSSRGSIGSDMDKDAAITVQMPALSSFSSEAAAPLRVTVPLANTVFQNGRRSTLLASLWHRQADALRRTAQAAHEHDLVVPPILSSSTSSSSISTLLFPLAEPLTIAAGLGNIVRQVVDPSTPGGSNSSNSSNSKQKPVPASRELEAAIPALLAARKRCDPALPDGAMAVWALVVPPALVPFYMQRKQQARPALDAVAEEAEHTADAEQQAAARTATHITELLAAGCRLHRVLSGGGGWGLKQGLLSLDPQMSHPAAAAAAESIYEKPILGEERRDDGMDDEAMLSFIRSFTSETSVGGTIQGGREKEAEEQAAAAAADGVAMPGAIVQFFVAPLASKSKLAATPPPATAGPSITLAAQAGDDGSQALATTTENDGTSNPVFIPNHFGAVSNHGIFLASSSSSSSSSSSTDGAVSLAIRTKLDAPGACVVFTGPADDTTSRT